MEEGGFSEVEADFMIKRGYVGDAAPGVKAVDKATVDIKEHNSWKMYRGPTEDLGKKVFSRVINEDQVASIMIFRNAKLTSTGNYEKLKAEGIERMRTAGLSEKEIKSVVSGDFDAGRAMASEVPKPPPVVAVKPSTPAPAQNPYYSQAESNFKTDPIYNLGQKELNSTEAKKSIDQTARMKFADDNDRAGYVNDSFQEDVAHIQKMKAKADSATTAAEKQKFEATVQVYSKRCKSWAKVYEQAGYSNTSIISNFKRQIENYCK